MEQGTLFIILGGFVANLLLLYLIINAATKATQRAKYEWAQMELLAKIAQAQGVAAEEIENVLNHVR